VARIGPIKKTAKPAHVEKTVGEITTADSPKSVGKEEKKNEDVDETDNPIEQDSQMLDDGSQDENDGSGEIYTQPDNWDDL